MRLLGMTALASALAAVAPMLLVALPTSAAGAADSAAPTCFGKPATITGSGLLRGTAGPDVIVAYGAAEVHALGGNDRVCGAFVVVAGAGADRVALHPRRRSTTRSSTADPATTCSSWAATVSPSWRAVAVTTSCAAPAGEQFLVGGPGRDRLFGWRRPRHPHRRFRTRHRRRRPWRRLVRPGRGHAAVLTCSRWARHSVQRCPAARLPRAVTDLACRSPSTGSLTSRTWVRW